MFFVQREAASFSSPAVSAVGFDLTSLPRCACFEEAVLRGEPFSLGGCVSGLVAAGKVLARSQETEFQAGSLLLLFVCSVMSDSVTPRTAAYQASMSFTISWSLLKLTSTELMTPSNHQSSVTPSLPSIFPSIRVFSSELALRIRWPKYWSFSISPSNEYSGLISFRIDWFDLAVQGTFQGLLQHIIQKHQFFGAVFFIV